MAVRETDPPLFDGGRVGDVEHAVGSHAEGLTHRTFASSALGTMRNR